MSLNIKQLILIVCCGIALIGSSAFGQRAVQEHPGVTLGNEGRRSGNFAMALNAYRSACEARDWAGCTGLANSYWLGLGVAMDVRRGNELYLQSCGAGNAVACKNLAVSHRDGIGVPTDPRRASELFEQACDLGNPDGCSGLGALIEGGRGTQQDYVRARELYQLACNNGSALGCSNLGGLYEWGRGVSSNINRALSLYRQACDARSAIACGTLGSMYEQGRHVDEDAGTARVYFERSISYAQEDCDYRLGQGCLILALFYARGKGVTPDLQMAAKFAEDGCNLHDPWACHVQAVFLETIPGQMERAVGLHRQACNGDVADACARLGQFYMQGNGVPQDSGYGAELIRKALRLAPNSGNVQQASRDTGIQ